MFLSIVVSFTLGSSLANWATSIHIQAGRIYTLTAIIVPPRGPKFGSWVAIDWWTIVADLDVTSRRMDQLRGVDIDSISLNDFRYLVRHNDGGRNRGWLLTIPPRISAWYKSPYITM